jgi:hypothetical protein
VFSGFFMPFDFEVIQQAALEHGVGHSYTLYDSNDSRTLYHCYRNSGGYTNLVHKEISRNKTKIRMPWEFYFVVHPDDLAQAFEIVSEQLLNSTKGAFYFTVADPSVPDEYGHRKQMTLYTFTADNGQMLQPEAVMFNHLRHIERAFVKHDIREGVGDARQYKIPGSQYIELKYYPVDGSHATQSMLELVQLPDNPYQLFTAPDAQLCVNASSREVAYFNTRQGRRQQFFTLSYLHAQAKINKEISEPVAAVPGYSACTYEQQGNYVDFRGDLLPHDGQPTPWRFNFWMHPDDLETAYQLISMRLLKDDKKHYYFSVLDPLIAKAMDDFPDLITLYSIATANGKRVQSSSDIYWSLSVIEKQFRMFGVRPGQIPDNLQKVNGSHYITMDYQPWNQKEFTPINEVTPIVNSAKNPFRLFGTPSSPLRIDYESLDEFRAAKAAYK